jgi:pyruvate dehydrogenase E2 component (dihydrolipoamide acetyltransferase)
MAAIVRIPKLGLSDYGELVSWEVAVGDRVAADEVIAVLESDKASADIESPANGVLLNTYVDEGEEIAIDVGKPLGAVGPEDETAPSLDELDSKPDEVTGASGELAPQLDQSPASGGGSSADVKATPGAKREARERNVNLDEVKGTGPQDAVTSDDIERYRNEQAGGETSTDMDGEAVKLTPRAKRRATGVNFDLGEVEGTGPQGAITEGDIDRHLDETDDDTAPSSSGGLTFTESRELTGTRKTIAERLSRSAREKPHVMGTREISIERLESIKDRLSARYDVDVSLNDLLLYFVGEVLQDLPEFNAHFEDDRHRLINEVNVGYAVDSAHGLIVPVIDGVGERSLQEVSERRRALVQSVLNDNHSAADLQGGTFTVTNVGVFGMDVSYSIINPPEVAILAIGRRKVAPVEREDGVKFERVVTFSLTIDHRVLDGADSGSFLEQLAEYVEYPGSVLKEFARE